MQQWVAGFVQTKVPDSHSQIDMKRSSLVIDTRLNIHRKTDKINTNSVCPQTKIRKCRCILVVSEQTVTAWQISCDYWKEEGKKLKKTKVKKQQQWADNVCQAAKWIDTTFFHHKQTIDGNVTKMCERKKKEKKALEMRGKFWVIEIQRVCEIRKLQMSFL